ncbi:alpha/beta hydrolase [Streptomyces echinatus]|uniref:alpha/beta hydrolase n=1 Tax=Streptomyces echinatus TaxID=67293 RepID=UPI00382A62E0
MAACRLAAAEGRGEIPCDEAAGTAEQLGDGTTLKLTPRGRHHGAYDQPGCVAPAAYDYLLNGKFPMDGAGCS